MTKEDIKLILSAAISYGAENGERYEGFREEIEALKAIIKQREKEVEHYRSANEDLLKEIKLLREKVEEEDKSLKAENVEGKRIVVSGKVMVTFSSLEEAIKWYNEKFDDTIVLDADFCWVKRQFSYRGYEMILC